MSHLMAQTQIRTFRLQYAAAEDVAETLREVLTGETQEGTAAEWTLGIERD